MSGPTLVRLLARLTDIDVPEPKQSLSDQLSQWLGWTDAITLSAALSGSLTAASTERREEGSGVEEQEFARVRASLTKAITDNRGSAGALGRGRGRSPAQAAPVNAPVDYAIYRQRYLSMQQTMETGIGNLRNRMRAALAAGTPRMAPLAAVDAVMEQALSARERGVLAAVPGLLESHFHRLRRTEEAALGETGAPEAPAKATSGAWLEVFRKDMRSVLLAELDIRFQPVDGLLAALRAS